MVCNNAMPGTNISAMIMHKTKSRVVVLVVGYLACCMHSYFININVKLIVNIE